MTNMCKETCPIFSGQCVPSECDIFKNRESDLYDENLKLRDKIIRLNHDNSEIKSNLIIFVSKKQELQKENGYLTNQLFWSEKTVERLLKENNELLNQTIELKRLITCSTHTNNL